MRWEKLGRILDPQNKAPWMVSHAALPFAVPLDEENVRVYCAGRDAQGRGQIGCVNFSLLDPARSAVVSAKPVLRIGPLGAFDDRGVLTACIAQGADRRYLYFTGVMLGQTVPFYYSIGLAVENGAPDGFDRVSAAPILDRSAVDPYLTASPFVTYDDGRWRMWYISGLRWAMENGAPKHYYHIRYAESDDGIAWRREGRVAIDFGPGEYAIARPSILRDTGLYRMWYCYRGESYRIGYAESADGVEWTRKDAEAGIDVSAGGWDCEMICYPHVFRHGGELYMIYNGNGYGKSGFGLARALQ